MNIYVRYCVRCGEAYDIGTDCDICPKCRRKKVNEVEKNAT